MANPLEKLKKLRGRTVRELRVRGEQALAAYTEQLGFAARLPTDQEFASLLDAERFGAPNPSAEDLLESFGAWTNRQFFAAFDDRRAAGEIFNQSFSRFAGREIIERAERILSGKFDLLGFSDLNFGVPVDWHFEPIAGKRSPLVHWKQFDESDSSQTGDKKIVWELNRHQHFFTLGAAYWLTGDERFAATFAAHLSGWMKQNPPGVGVNWMSSLEVALRAVSWLWALHFFKLSPNYTPLLHREVLKFLYLHGRHVETYLSTFYSPNTHLTGEALGLYYLGTLLPELRRAAHWRTLGRKILLDELDRQILPDGVYFERTTWYQRYTIDFYTHFLILSRINQDVMPPADAAKLETKLQLALDFLLFAARPDGTTPLLGDDDGGRMLPHSQRSPNDFRSALAVGAALFGRNDYKFAAEESSEELFWLLGAEGLEQFEKLPATEPAQIAKDFPDGGYFVMRDNWGRDADFLLADCGAAQPNASGHRHADALSIELAANGRSVLVDPGTFSYAEKEVRNYFRSGAAHNAATIDGAGASEPDRALPFKWLSQAAPGAPVWTRDERFAFFENSLSGFSQTAEPGAHTRSILFLPGDYWIMRDFVQLAGEHEFQLNFHFDPNAGAKILFSDHEAAIVSAVGEENDAGLRLYAFADNATARISTGRIAPCYGLQIPTPVLEFASRGAGAAEFFTFLLPVREAVSIAPQIAEIPINNGRSFEIAGERFRDFLIYTDSGEFVRTKLFTSNFRFAWARFDAAEETLEELILIGGSQFVYGSREIVNHPSQIKFAVARRIGNKLHVRTDDSRYAVSLPQQRRPTKYVVRSAA